MLKKRLHWNIKGFARKTPFKGQLQQLHKVWRWQWHYCLLDILSLKRKLQSVPLSLYIIRDEILQQPYRALLERYQLGDQFGINFADWNRLMNLEEEPEGDEGCIDKIHEIEMKNVEFRYPQRSESAVKNINLRILTGEKIAIVGENGSGKTTLLYLLLGIYRPISGEASVNGKTMELNLDNYRKKTACLIQNFVHFQMTLRENLAPNDFSELSEDPLIDFANNFPDRLNTF